jgi:hypothetical protein
LGQNRKSESRFQINVPLIHNFKRSLRNQIRFQRLEFGQDVDGSTQTILDSMFRKLPKAELKKIDLEKFRQTETDTISKS